MGRVKIWQQVKMMEKDLVGVELNLEQLTQGLNVSRGRLATISGGSAALLQKRRRKNGNFFFYPNQDQALYNCQSLSGSLRVFQELSKSVFRPNIGSINASNT